MTEHLMTASRRHCKVTTMLQT